MFTHTHLSKATEMTKTTKKVIVDKPRPGFYVNAMLALIIDASGDKFFVVRGRTIGKPKRAYVQNNHQIYSELRDEFSEAEVITELTSAMVYRAEAPNEDQLFIKGTSLDRKKGASAILHNLLKKHFPKMEMRLRD